MGSSSVSSLTCRDSRRNHGTHAEDRELEETFEGSLQCHEDSDSPIFALNYPKPITPEENEARTRVRRELDIWYECLMCNPSTSQYEVFLTDLWLDAKADIDKLEK